MMKKLTILLLAVTGLVLTGCTSYPPVFYQQIYHLNGKRSDADKPYDVGVPLPVAEFRTELQKLYALYPDAVGKIPASSYNRRGWFFIQKDLQRTLGGGTGDLCNHAAWYVLNLVKDKKQQAEYAKKIAGFMRDFDDQGAMLLLEDFRKKLMPDGVILVAQSWHDPDNRFMLKSSTERYSGTLNGKTNPRFGLSRTYYPNGMLAMDMFYYDDAPVGYAFTYTMDGKLNEIYFYDGKGNRKLCHSAGQK